MRIRAACPERGLQAVYAGSIPAGAFGRQMDKLRQARPVGPRRGRPPFGSRLRERAGSPNLGFYRDLQWEG